MKYSFITFFGFALAIISFGWFIGTSDYTEVYAVFAAVELKYIPLMLNYNSVKMISALVPDISTSKCMINPLLPVLLPDSPLEWKYRRSD